MRLLRGKSILAMPDEIVTEKGIFGYNRFYTTGEMESAMSKLGFTLERCMIESNNSGYRGTPGSLKRRMYRFFEFLEERLETLRLLGDTWYMAFRKNAA